MNSHFIPCVVSAFVILAAAGASAFAAIEAQEATRLFSEANHFFQEGNQASATDPNAAEEAYEKAILRFERLIDEGGCVNGKLYYNLANAYFLSGDIGRAILNYRRAEGFLPNDPNLRQNLAYARKQRPDRIDETQQKRILKTLFFWHYDLNPRIRMTLFALLYAALWILAGLRLFKRHLALNWGIALSAVCALALFASVNLEAHALASDTSGVILQEEVIARKGNGETYQPSFETPLHAGVEFKVIEDRNDWLHVELPDQRDCWLPAAAVERVR